MPSTHTSLHVHIVFSTKQRVPMIDAAWRERLHAYLGGAVGTVGGVPVAVGGTADHVHLLVGLRATHRVADLLREIKHASSQWLHEEGLSPKFRWQAGYGAFAVSASAVPEVTRYVLNQERHHRRRSFQEEYVTLLRKSGVEYDERYLWDD